MIDPSHSETQSGRQLVPVTQGGQFTGALAFRRRLAQRRDSDVSVRFLWSVWQQWWRIVLPVTLLLAAGTVAGTMAWFQPQYRATAWLQVKGTQPYVAFPEREAADRESVRKYVNTQIELLRSPLILNRALADPQVASIDDLNKRRDPVDYLARRGLEISPRGDSELLEIAYTGPNAKDAAIVVNAVINSYFALRKEHRDDQAKTVMLLLEKERLRRAEEIRLLQDEIRRLQQLAAKEPSLLAGVSGGGDVVISDSPLQGLQNSLAAAEIDREVLAAQTAALEATTATPVSLPAVLIEREIDHQPEVMQLIALLNQKQATFSSLKKTLVRGEEDPKAQRMAREIAQLEESLESLRESARPRIEREMQAMADLSRQQQLDLLRTQLQTQDLIVRSMRQNYDKMVDDLSKTGGYTVDLKFKQAELQRKQQVFDRISSRAVQLATEMFAPRRVEPIQQALPPKIPLEQLPWKQLGFGVLLSLTLPFGLCAVRERTVRRVTDVEQLQEDTEVPVVGEVASLPVAERRRRGSSPMDPSHELGLFEESIDTLRTGLVLSAHDQPLEVIAVASAVSGEGKSSVASQLAVSLARASGGPVLLIDGDMRSPDLHRIFEIPVEPGLADVLEQRIELDKAICRSWSEQVHILPAGKLEKSPHKLLGSGAFDRIIQQARQQYRYVVLDTPPVLAAGEAMVMARQADGTLICAMRDVSREMHVKMTYQRLMAVGARPLGTVLNGVPVRQYAKRYGSYAY